MLHNPTQPSRVELCCTCYKLLYERTLACMLCGVMRRRCSASHDGMALLLWSGRSCLSPAGSLYLCSPPWFLPSTSRLKGGIVVGSFISGSGLSSFVIFEWRRSKTLRVSRLLLLHHYLSTTCVLLKHNKPDRVLSLTMQLPSSMSSRTLRTLTRLHSTRRVVLVRRATWSDAERIQAGARLTALLSRRQHRRRRHPRAR